ncbi:UDP-glucose 4-epimerase GalE [Myroides sp. LJL119]
MKKILVTGGLGFIGSHTVVELLNSDFKVVIIDDLSNSRIQVLENIQKITGKTVDFYPYDLKDQELTLRVFQSHHFDGVIHFAAYKSVSESEASPIDYYENNIGSLVSVLKAMQKTQVTNLIFSSSCTVYGQADIMPINEQTALKRSESCYGRTKQMGEDIIADFVKAYHKKATLLRYFNPIGAHPSGLIGELPNGIPNNLIPYVMQTAAGIREYLNIWGDDYPTQDGTAIRDYIYVGDLAKAHLAALQNLLDSKQNQDLKIFNLGTGKGTSVLEIVKCFEKVNQIQVPFSIAPRRQGDITIAYANVDKAERELNWKAQTSVEESLRTAWKWQLNTSKLELV